MSRQLALVVGLFVAIVGCLLFLSSVELEIMSGVRAYVGGEAAWSKGQKDAAYHLLRYALSRDAREYDGYRRAIAVPLGDRAARRRLERPPGPRDDQARRGFLAGRNHPDDVPMLERLCQLATNLLDCAAGETFLWDADAAVFVPVARVAGGVDDALSADATGRAAVDVRFSDGDVAELVPGRLAMALRRGGEVVGIHVVRADDGTPITPERRQIAEGMAQVASLALANAHLVAEFARASRLKSEFVSTMSHELRTPLNVILGYAEMARESTDAPARAECLRRVELAARDLLDLIESTLEVGRIDAGRDAVRLEPVALHEFLAQLGERCARLPRRPGVDLVWDDAVPACVVTTDPRKLTVVLRNLVGNALKFTERVSVRVDVAVETESIAIRVADTGMGIRAEDQASIFEIFRQGDGSDTRRFGGTGLGLYLVRRFVDQLFGRIELESEPGRGAAFTVTLPRATPAVVPRAA